MAELKCPRCLRLISPEDTIQFGEDGLAHADCQRLRDLSPEERALLIRYCFDHAVATCPKCGEDFRQTELVSDCLGDRAHLCPRCGVDLTERLREHVYCCAMLPGEVRRRSWEARATARRLVKHSRELSDHADVLMREAEAAIAALREAIRRMASGG